MRLIDLKHLGNERVIGSWLLDDVLIDPGPSTCLETLLHGLDGQRPRVIALTHIHLDHAGATGTLLKRMPEVEVWVHERGAPHLIDPERLLKSAARLYGQDMERLWGEVLPVPQERVRVLHGGERIDSFEVAYTPGHASHHVSYLHLRSRTAFCGDTAGVRILHDGPALAPTPPPDIDPPTWRRSLDAIEAWRPIAIVPTHFGSYEDVGEHLAQMRSSLAELEELARRGSEEQYVSEFDRQLDRLAGDVSGGAGDGPGGEAGDAPGGEAGDAPGGEAGDGPGGEAGDGPGGKGGGALRAMAAAVAYRQAMPPDQSYAGLRRYIEKSAEKSAS